jgi:hypothetical protein
MLSRSVANEKARDYKREKSIALHGLAVLSSNSTIEASSFKIISDHDSRDVRLSVGLIFNSISEYKVAQETAGG